MILTKEFLNSHECCIEGYRFGLENNLIDKDYDFAIKFCKENGQPEFAEWLESYKKSEYYVRNNGKVITMAYQIYNPLTGIHYKYETEEEVREQLVIIANEVVKQYCPMVNIEIANENGDTTWIPTNINESLVVS
jgi:hypothetical protein